MVGKNLNKKMEFGKRKLTSKICKFYQKFLCFSIKRQREKKERNK
jgi:hypothetical protein